MFFKALHFRLLDIAFKLLIGSSLIVPICSVAKPVFIITPTFSNTHIKPKESSIINFSITNNSGIDMPDISFEANYLPNNLLNTRLVHMPGDCEKGGDLTKNASCNITVEVVAGSSIGEAKVIPRFCGYNGFICSRGTADVSITDNLPTKGHFSFLNNSGHEIFNLDLAPGASGTVTLHNTGGTGITAFSLGIGSIPAGVTIGGTCTSVTNIASGASCTIIYSVTATPTAGTFNITATGTGADNAPQMLTTNVASAGHFVFRNSGGSDITSLDLAPNTSGTVTLRNTGGATIQNINLNIGAAIGGYFTGSCRTVTILAPNDICNLNYNIPSSVVSGIHQIIATGDNTDNSPSTLFVSAEFPKAFITNLVASSDTIRRCSIEPSSGLFHDCVDIIDNSFDNPSDVIFNSSGTRAYITNFSNSTVTKCNVSAVERSFSSCTDTGAQGLILPRSIELNATGTRAFIVNYSAVTERPTVTQCTVSQSTGDFSNCTTSIGNIVLGEIIGSRFNTDYSRAYLINIFSSRILRCGHDSGTGLLSGCVDAGATSLSSPEDMRSNKNPSNPWAVITNFNTSSVILCDINSSTGDFTSCRDSLAYNIAHPHGIALDMQINKAFIVNNISVTKCEVDQDGLFSNCADTNATEITNGYHITILP